MEGTGWINLHCMVGGEKGRLFVVAFGHTFLSPLGFGESLALSLICGLRHGNFCVDWLWCREKAKPSLLTDIAVSEGGTRQQWQGGLGRAGSKSRLMAALTNLSQTTYHLYPFSTSLPALFL